MSNEINAVTSRPRIGTLVQGDEDPAKAIADLAPRGFESFSISWWQTIGNADLPRLAEAVRSAIEGSGTVLSCLSLYGNPLASDEAAGETRRSFEALIDAAPSFGASTVSGFAGRVPGTSVADSIDPWKGLFSGWLEKAAARGLTIGLENCRMGDTWKTGKWNIAINPEAWELMFEAIPDRALGLEWEPCHPLLSLADPLECLASWAGRVVHVHGKDANVDWSVVRSCGVHGKRKFATQRTAGFGDTDWTEVFRILRGSGYAGTVDIEGGQDPVYREDREIEGQVLGMEYLKACREKAYGTTVR
jgi:sugar phosphate isomerase/epimerase